MLVASIYDDAKEALGYCSEAKVFSRITDAIEVLSNKGQWDSLLTYLVITTTGNNDIITLPTSVDAVLRININGNPSFARDRMWEFTLDGPGTSDPRIGFQWEDLGDTPHSGYIAPPNAPLTDPSTEFTEGNAGILIAQATAPESVVPVPSFLPVGSSGVTFPLRVTITARDGANNSHLIYTLDGSDPTWIHGTHGGRNVVLTLNADTTIKAVTARVLRASHELSDIRTEIYTEAAPPPEPPPVPPPDPGPPPPIRAGNRIIRLSQKAVSVRALVRLRPGQVTSKDNWIPLDSKLAIILMLKAIESYKRATPQDFQLGQGQEEQALKFLSEEQKSRNIFTELSQAMDNPPMVGYTYHANNAVVVADIYDEASAICGGVGKNYVFDRISEAIEVLSNKGQWDGMTAYLDLVPSSDVIGLPRQVENPIRINIEDKPSIPRSRMFEFSTNGPGTNLDELTTLTWEDQGETNLIIPLPHPSAISVGGQSADAGKQVTVIGLDTNGIEQTHVYTIPANQALQVSSPVVWKTITRISKDTTIGGVSVFANFTLVAFLYPDENETVYRKIKLNKVASAIKIMFRKASLKVSSVNDIIPLKSRSSILLMMRALQAYKNPSLTPEVVAMAGQLEAQALKFLQEEEQSKLAYAQASSKDIAPAVGVNQNSRDVVLAGDVYDDAADVFGPVGRQRLFDKINESIEMLANKSTNWDGLDGYVDILTDQNGYISMPAKVEVPIAMNFCRGHTQMRNKWYEFHMNGMSCGDSILGNYWDDLGDYPLIHEPSQPLHLFAITNQAADANIVIRAYGYDAMGNWIKSNENGEFVDGAIVPLTVHLLSQTSEPQIRVTTAEFEQVSRVTKEVSGMPIQLFATGNLILPSPTPNTNTPPSVQLLAIYDAAETEPLFRRLRVPSWVKWVRMRYRARTTKVDKMSDLIQMRSKTAVVTMMRSLKAIEGGDLNAAQAFETKAVQLISDEQTSRNPGETFELQFDQATSWADPLQGRF